MENRGMWNIAQLPCTSTFCIVLSGGKRLCCRTMLCWRYNCTQVPTVNSSLVVRHASQETLFSICYAQNNIISCIKTWSRPQKCKHARMLGNKTRNALKWVPTVVNLQSGDLSHRCWLSLFLIHSIFGCWLYALLDFTLSLYPSCLTLTSNSLCLR